jgi:hypothetical protein
MEVSLGLTIACLFPASDGDRLGFRTTPTFGHSVDQAVSEKENWVSAATKRPEPPDAVGCVAFEAGMRTLPANGADDPTAYG